LVKYLRSDRRNTSRASATESGPPHPVRRPGWMPTPKGSKTWASTKTASCRIS
jgi:hypothetical protein